MTTHIASGQVEWIPIDRIRVLNPRSRSRAQQQDFVENIRRVGLKRPITVSRRQGSDGVETFDLICGQGRLEAFQQLGEKGIPALVRELPEPDCMLMSLIENIARRKHPPLELMREIGRLVERGHSEASVAERTGYSPRSVRHILTLLNCGEERLLAAVERGAIPVTMAAEVASSDSKQIQQILADAYERGEFRGRRLTVARKLLERRAQGDKRLHVRTGPRCNEGQASCTPTGLRRLYQKEAARQRLIIKKADFTHTRLIFLTEAFRQLFASKEFVALAKAEGCADMPKPLSDRINAEATS